MKKKIIDRIRGKLIVSCQALPDEPLHSSYIMSRMAYAAMLGGAGGIRANTVEDIMEIKKTVDLPIIGIIKKVYPGLCENLYITPTVKEVDQLVECGVDIIALDATSRPRPDGKTLDEMFSVIRRKYPDQLFMADCSNFEEGIHAEKLGFDFVGTTLAGYTDYTAGTKLPDIPLMKKLVENLSTPVIAEGGIWSPEQLKAAMDVGVTAAVVGSAITRPMEITKYFIKGLR
ncbi:MAG TPA: N-acetylmannosamine-6-phosphate 2-epimerase [Clostridiales bacterium]|nr:N-acetylmannosamine-6-phosphate 2-epimerase [Clostridiales bacterium]